MRQNFLVANTFEVSTITESDAAITARYNRRLRWILSAYRAERWINWIWEIYDWPKGNVVHNVIDDWKSIGNLVFFTIQFTR